MPGRAAGLTQSAILDTIIFVPLLHSGVAVKRLLLAAMLFLVAHTSASAWGVRGHAIVAIIAERHLTPKTSDAVGKLLALDGKTAMKDVASWADHVVDLKIPTEPSHMVLLGTGHEPYNPATDCEKNECVLSAVDADIAVLTDPIAPPDAKELALKYLIHFVGDVHMPMHAARAGLGRHALYQGKLVGIHFLWDNDVVDSQTGSVEAVAAEVETSATPFRPGTVHANRLGNRKPRHNARLDSCRAAQRENDGPAARRRHLSFR